MLAFLKKVEIHLCAVGTRCLGAAVAVELKKLSIAREKIPPPTTGEVCGVGGSGVEGSGYGVEG